MGVGVGKGGWLWYATYGGHGIILPTHLSGKNCFHDATWVRTQEKTKVHKQKNTYAKHHRPILIKFLVLEKSKQVEFGHHTCIYESMDSTKGLR